jgi:hypothetical protein
MQGKNQATKKVQVSDDPEVMISAQDRAARQAALSRGWELYKSAMQGAARLHDLKVSLTATMNAWQTQDAKVPEALRTDAAALAKKLDQLAPLFTGPADQMSPPIERLPPPVPERLAHVVFILESYTSAPRQRDLEQIDELAGVEQDAMAKLKQLFDVDLAKLNKSFAEAGVPYVALPAHPSGGN